MKYIITGLLTLFSSVFCLAQTEFRKIGEIDINYEQLAKDYELNLNEIHTADKKAIGKYDCFHVIDIIKKFIGDIPENQRTRLVIVAKNKSGNAQPFTYFDIDPKHSPLPPMVSYKKAARKLSGDTIRIHEKEGKLELEKFMPDVKLIVQTQLSLQVKSLSQKEINQFFTNPSLIVPLDKTTSRWIDNVSKLEFYFMDNKLPVKNEPNY